MNIFIKFLKESEHGPPVQRNDELLSVRPKKTPHRLSWVSNSQSHLRQLMRGVHSGEMAVV
jgi:hypothetical protein